MSNAWALAPVVVVAISLVGVVLLTLGLRGRPMFSSPRCGKCGYDLRNMQFMSETIGNCPECGKDLAGPGAVSFGKWRRQPRRIALGVAMVILPWAGAFALGSYIRSQAIARGGGPQAKAGMTTPALLGSLKANVNSPWDWQELERRLKSGSLAQADVDAAIGVLVNDLNAKRAAGTPQQPLQWADRFITPALATGTASPAQVTALAQAFYGTGPGYTMRSRARTGEPMALQLSGEPWNLPGMRLVWWLKSVVADGTTPLTPQLRYPNVAVRSGESPPPLNPDLLSGDRQRSHVDLLVPHSLAAGEHEIALTFEMGVVSDSAALRGLDGRPGTPDKWPAPVARWQSVMKKTVTVREGSPISLVTDATKNPLTSGRIEVEEALTRAATRGTEMVIKFKFSGEFSPVVAYRVAVQAGEQTIDYSTLVAGRLSRSGSIRSHSEQANVPAIAPEVKTIDILLTPDPAAAERFPQIEEIWGQPHTIKNVPLQRFE